jgi:hypothetical protein
MRGRVSFQGISQLAGHHSQLAKIAQWKDLTAPQAGMAALTCKCSGQRGKQPGEQPRLLSVGLGDLADENGPAHIHGGVDPSSLRSRVIFEDFHHQSRVVREDNARL